MGALQVAGPPPLHTLSSPCSPCSPWWFFPRASRLASHLASSVSRFGWAADVQCEDLPDAGWPGVEGRPAPRGGRVQVAPMVGILPPESLS